MLNFDGVNNNNKDALIELNHLWEPVRPYLALLVHDLYKRSDGNIIEIGPFSGLIFNLAGKKVGSSFTIALFPEEITSSIRNEALLLGLQDEITIQAADESLKDIPQDAFDLVIFRGAFFFPSFFRPDLTAVYRTLKAGGVALVGGGFGIHTPDDVIKRIGKRSVELNQQLGRIRVTKEDIKTMLRSACLEKNADIMEEGGLWVILRK